MKGLKIITRTSKTEGTIKLRFRLRDGRQVDLYHKSDITADIKDLAKFTDNGDIKPHVKIYNKQLKHDIDMAIVAIEEAYSNLCEKVDKSSITNEDFEDAIDEVLHPQKARRSKMDLPLIDRYELYIIEGTRDGNFGEGRAKHYKVSLGELKRYLTIKHKEDIPPAEFDSDDLMDFRQFLINEYQYVKKYQSYYDLLSCRNLPTECRDQNTVATKMKKIQAFYNELVEKGELQVSPFSHLGKNKKRTMMKESYDPPIFLTYEEFQKVMDTEVTETLQETKDAFLLQCAFGCRISDYKKLSIDKISVTEEGVPYIHYLPAKTMRENIGRKEIETPILRYAYDIIMKYKFNFHILKYVSGKSGYNKKIKELLELCEINRKCPIYDDAVGDNVYTPLYEVASNKLCRKTHVDILTKAQINMYAAGLHEEGSNAVYHYTHMSIKDRFVLMCYAYHQPLYYVDDGLNIMREDK